MSNKYNNTINCQYKTMMVGNSIDVDMCNIKESEIRADVLVSEYDAIRLWGQIQSTKGFAVANALIKLVKVVCSENGESYQGIAHTISDCQGFYQFDLCALDHNARYKILVGKSVTGPERIIDTKGGNCDVCHSDYNPCKPYNPVVNSPCQCQHPHCNECENPVHHCDCGYCETSNCNKIDIKPSHPGTCSCGYETYTDCKQYDYSSCGNVKPIVCI